jgi:predicted dehydrogenase
VPADSPVPLATSGPAAPLRVAVVGAGVFGRNHLRVYRELEHAGLPVELAAVIDPDHRARASAETDFAVPTFPAIETFTAASPALRIDAASLCVPTVQHVACAELLLRSGIDLLIEKPLAATLPEADRILALARTHARIVQPGHLERFNPAVQAVRPLLNRPMFFEVHRLSVFTPRSLDVDVVLDLMIHDLDIVMDLVASPVRELRAVGLPVLSPKVDIANVRLEFENGCVANFTASRVSTERVRKMRFFQPHQYLSLDFARQDLLVIDVTAAAGMSPDQLAAAAALGAHPSPGLSLTKVPVHPGEPLRLEIEAFLHAVRTRTQPLVTAEQGRAALDLALEINAAIASHSRRTGL